ncbi:MAG: metallophosphoesterase family protein [Candidatus Micrarchaeia archaeon]
MKLLVVSDVHGNYEALEAVASAVQYDEVLCLGDLVDFGPDPRECVEWARQSARYIVRGNHDHALANNVACGCPSKRMERLAEATRGYSHSVLDAAEIDFLKGLPLKLAASIGGRSFYAVHGGPRDPLYQLIMARSDRALGEELAGIDAEFILLGHTHHPFVNSTAIDGKVVINPGSVGQPRDGDNRASAAVLDLDSGAARILRVKYDVDIVCRKMAHAGFPSELAGILKTGR